MFTQSRMNLISIRCELAQPGSCLVAGPRDSPAGRYLLLSELSRVRTPESLLLVQNNSKRQ